MLAATFAEDVVETMGAIGEKDMAEGTSNFARRDVSGNQIQSFPKIRCGHPTCRYNMIDGHPQMPSVRTAD